ncbi:putative lipoprotein [Staphylococcus aureus]|nr:putative lipoprotein [Staphylococcus aureus]
MNELEFVTKHRRHLHQHPELSLHEFESSPDSCVKCYTMFLPFLLIKIDVFS